MGVGTLTRAFDEITAQDLRNRGSLKWTRYGGDTIGAFVAEMDFGAAPAIIHALHDAVAHATFGYLPPALSEEVSRACARWQHHAYGWSVAPERICAVPDVLTAFEIVLRHFAAPDTPVILPTPTYMPFLTVPSLHGRQVRQVPMVVDNGRYALDLDGIDRAFRDGGKLLVLCNPANPVGRVFTVEELQALAEVVDRHGGLVFSDEIHAPLVYSGHRHVPYASVSDTTAAHTITATSASKAWNLPGLKCAQILFSNESHLETWRRIGSYGSVAASTLGAVATVAAYRSGGGWLADVLAYLDRNRRALAELLPQQIGYRPPEGTYLAWLDCRGVHTGTSPGTFLREQAGVATVDGAECGEAGAGFVRLNFATPLPILESAVVRMVHALRRK